MAESVTPRLAEDLLEGLDVGVVATDAAGRLIFANPVALELLGVELDEVRDRTVEEICWDAVDVDGQPVGPEALPSSRARRDRRPVRDVVVGVARPRRADRVWLLAHATPRLDDRGEVRQVVVSLSDISSRRALETDLRESNAHLAARVEPLSRALRAEAEERRDAQRALAERERRLSLVLDTMSEGVVLIDPAGRIREANPAATRILGAELEAIEGTLDAARAWRVLDRRGRPITDAQMPSHVARRTGAPVRGRQLGLPHPDGGTRWLRVNAEPMWAEPRAGRAPWVLVTFTDATDEERAKLELERTLDDVRLLLAAAPGLMLYRAEVEASGAARLSHLAGATEALLGLRPEAAPVDPRTLATRVHPEDLSALLPAFDPAEAGELGSIDAELRVRPDPESPWRWVSVRALPDVRGDRVVWSGAAVDVDERRKIGAAMLEVEKHDILEVLASGVAHNFNNLLTVILPNLDEAHERAPAELRPLLEDALDAAHQTRELVTQLMVVGRRDLPRVKRPLDIAHLLDEVVELLRATLEREGVRLVVERSGLIAAPVLGDPARLHSTLMELSMNARAAVAGRQGAQITFRLEVEPSAIQLSVEDNGVGLSPAALERLGQPFFSVGGQAQGTGLGVATAFGVIRDHGGELRYETSLGRGTSARVTLPRFERAASAPAELDPPEGPRGRVLVVDDDALVRRSLRRQLAGAGLEIEEAEDGRDALARVEQAPPDVVLLDVGLPGLSGTEVLRRIGATRARLPVVLMSGSVPDTLHELGAAAVLRKPVDGPQLLDLVSALLESEPSSDPDPGPLTSPLR